jgi:hypothetical protein
VQSLSSLTPISSSITPFTLGSLLATVPLSATANYGAMQLLHFSSEQLNGASGPITAASADAVQVAAYFGDVTDAGGPFSIADAQAIAAAASGVANTAAQTLPGFTAFPNLDPTIIGDVSLQSIVNFTDAGVMIQEVGGTARVTIPYAPLGLPVTPVGPDPTLTVPTGLTAAAGSLVVMPASMGNVVKLQQPVAGANFVGASVLPAAVVERLFGTRHHFAAAIQGGPLLRQSAVLTGGALEQAQSGVRDLAATAAQAELGQPNLLSKEDLAYLWQTASGSLLGPVLGSHVDGSQTTNDFDGVGLDAVIGSD